MPTATEIQASFARRLAKVREAKGYMIRREAADSLDVQENTYTSWERGTKKPTYFHLVAIKRKWGVSLDYLIDGDSSGLPIQLFNEMKKLQENADQPLK